MARGYVVSDESPPASVVECNICGRPFDSLAVRKALRNPGLSLTDCSERCPHCLKFAPIPDCAGGTILVSTKPRPEPLVFQDSLGFLRAQVFPAGYQTFPQTIKTLEVAEIA